MEKEFIEKGRELALKVDTLVKRYSDLNNSMVTVELMIFEKLDEIIRQNPRVLVIYYQDNLEIIHEIYEALIITLGFTNFDKKVIKAQFGNYLCAYII